MRGLLVITAFIAAMSMICIGARSNELDNESSPSAEQIHAARALPRTLVVRVRAGTNEVSVLHSRSELEASTATVGDISRSSFTRLDNNGHMVGELDRDTSRSSWGFFCPLDIVGSLLFPFFSPTYYYAGYAYNYQPYYSCAYNGYNYSYYNWPY